MSVPSYLIRQGLQGNSVSSATPNDVVSLKDACVAIDKACIVAREYPYIQTIISFIARRVTLSVLAVSESYELRAIVQDIIASIVKVGYVAVYVNNQTGRIGVVPVNIYAALTFREFSAVTGDDPPTEHIGRANVKQTHYPYFFDFSEGESYFHTKYGYPIVFIGEWPPDHGMPTTPCSRAYDNLLVRNSIIEATRIAAIRCAQPPTGFVMTQQMGGMAHVLRRLEDGVTSSVGPAEVLSVAEQIEGNRYETHQAMAEDTTDRMYTHKKNVSAEHLAAQIWSGGEGNMSWTPPAQPAAFDIGKLDDLICGVAAQYGVPARAFQVTRTSGNTASLEEANGVHWMITSHLTFVRQVLKTTLDVVKATVGQVADTLDPDSLQVCVPLDLLMGVEKQLSSRGRQDMFARALGVDDAMINSRSVEEIKGDLSMKLEKMKTKIAADGAPAAKRRRKSDSLEPED